MAGGYASVKGGAEGLAARILDLQRQIDSLRGAAGTKSAILRGDRMTWQTLDGTELVQIGSIAFPDGDTGQGLAVWDADDGTPIAFLYRNLTEGFVRAQFGRDAEMLDGFAVNAVDVDFDASVFNVDAGTVIRLNAGTDVEISAPAGQVDLDGTTLQCDFTGAANINAGSDVNISAAANIDLDPTSNLRFFIGSHAVPANLSISANVVRVVSSAAKYKADVEDLVVDRDELFAVSGKTYVDASEKERHAADPELQPPTRYPGFIADEWAEHETLRQFVRFEDGQVEGFHYDRVSAALLEAAKQQQAEIDELKNQVAKLVARLDSEEV